MAGITQDRRSGSSSLSPGDIKLCAQPAAAAAAATGAGAVRAYAVVIDGRDGDGASSEPSDSADGLKAPPAELRAEQAAPAEAPSCKDNRAHAARPASNASAKARLSAVVVTRNDQYARDQLVWSSIAEHTLGE